MKRIYKKIKEKANPKTLSHFSQEEWDYIKMLKISIWNKNYLSLFLSAGSIVEGIMNKKINYKNKIDEKIPFSFRFNALNSHKEYLSSSECRRFIEVYINLRHAAAHGDDHVSYTKDDIKLFLKAVLKLLKDDISVCEVVVKSKALVNWRLHLAKKNQLKLEQLPIAR